MIPNLPGFRSSRPLAKPIAQSLQVQHGYMLVDQRPVTAPSPPAAFVSAREPVREGDYHDLGGRYSLSSQQRDRALRVQHLPFNDEASLPNFLKFDRKVLRFNGYHEEDVSESTFERQRVRKCLVYYYLENDTIQMIEPTEENSGMPQGAFVRRHRIPKPRFQHLSASDSLDCCEYYVVDDLYVGAELEVYKKKIKIYDCDDFTRQYLAAAAAAAAQRCKGSTPLPCPEGEYNRLQRLRMQRETGADTTIKRNRRMHPMKLFMEAQLGKPQSVANLGSFLSHDRHVLRFECVWDDTSRLYGDVLKFKLHYFLCDDTIEILNEKANGRDPVPKLLGRRRLPLPSGQALLQATGPLGALDEAETPCYHWKDLRLGDHIEVFHRRLLLVDADPFTFAYYEREFEPLGPPIKIDDGSLPPDLLQMDIPPYNGFGSEEDSLRSVYSIRPKKPTRDLSAADDCGKVLRFSIKMAHARSEDRARVFILQYYVVDDTLSIRETVLRNSGHVAGNFLRRGRVRKPAAARSPTTTAPRPAIGIWGPPPVIQYYEAADIYVGAVLVFLGHDFVIYEADEYSLRYMESKGAPTFPNSDLAHVLHALKPHVDRLRAILPDTANIASAAALKPLIDDAAGLDSIPLHGCITLARAARRADNNPQESGPFSAAALRSVLGLL